LHEGIPWIALHYVDVHCSVGYRNV
jgi:hypothetical protein